MGLWAVINTTIVFLNRWAPYLLSENTQWECYWFYLIPIIKYNWNTNWKLRKLYVAIKKSTLFDKLIYYMNSNRHFKISIWLHLNNKNYNIIIVLASHQSPLVAFVYMSYDSLLSGMWLYFPVVLAQKIPGFIVNSNITSNLASVSLSSSYDKVLIENYSVFVIIFWSVTLMSCENIWLCLLTMF